MALKRELLATFLNAAKLNQTPSYELLGEDLEEKTTALNPSVEKKKNILGKTSVILGSYEAQDSISPYYAEKGSNLSERLREIVDNRLTHDDVKSDVVDVELWREVSTNTYEAYKEECVIAVESFGGDTNGIAIPFTLHRTGKRTKGTFNIETKEFTPSEAVLKNLQVELAVGSAELKTKVTDVIGEGLGSLKYKIGPDITSPTYGVSDTGFTDLSLNTDLDCTAKSNKIIVVESDSNNKIVAVSAIKKVVCL